MKISVGRFVGKDKIKRSRLLRAFGFVSIVVINEILERKHSGQCQFCQETRFHI